jgi:hypothetical protein
MSSENKIVQDSLLECVAVSIGQLAFLILEY